MEKKTCFYETLFVISGALAETDAKSVQDKFTALIADNGNLIAVNEWGKRRLAYPINKVSEGYYVLASFESAPEFPLELERLFGINDAILRSMVTRLEKAPEASVAAPEAAPAEVVAAPVSEAPVNASAEGMVISPRAKILAEKTGADLRFAVPTGAKGRIISDDVERVVSAGHTVSAAARAEYDAMGGSVAGTGMLFRPF